MAGMGGLSGLAFVNQGYNKGAQDYWNTQNLETDNAATQALGRGLQSLVQAPMPGARPIGGPPSPGVPVPPQMQPGVGGPPQAGAPQPPMAGPAVAGGGGPQFQGSPLWQMLAGGPRPQAPMPMQGGGGAAPPQGPPMSPQGQPPQGGPPGGSPFTQPMTWQDVARAVVQANPGAPPQVIAAAVTKAMPLMQADSQQQWRAIQAQLAEERARTAAGNLEERKRHDQSTEVAGAENRDIRRQAAADRAADAAARREDSHQRIQQGWQRLDQGQRKLELDAWTREQRAWEKGISDQINIAANVGNTKEAARLRTELQNGQDKFRADFAEMQKKINAATSGAPTQGGPPAPGQLPKPPEPTASEQQLGKSKLKDAITAQPPSGQTGKPLPAENKTKIQAYIKANPDRRDDVIKQGQQDGWDMSGL